MDVQGIPVTGWTQHYRHSPRSDFWVNQIGKAFWAMHHYCWAMIHLQRSNQIGITPQLKEHMIRTAIADYMYVIINSDEKFLLLTELYYRIGRAHLLLRESWQALEAFEKSLAAKPDYWPAFIGLADSNALVGRLAEAIAAIDRGLAVMPQQKNLLAARERFMSRAQESPPKRKTPSR
jgi:tetratricopeptide (TPR) repeat protein